MNNRITMVVGGFLVLILVIYMMCFQVRYDQVGVLTTFDRAGENSTYTEPGLYFKWPWPIQKVYTYSNRIQLLEDQLEETQTADGKSVIVKSYLAWTIEDPLQFFVALTSTAEAGEQLYALMRENRGVISQYAFDQLVNSDPAKLKLAEVEQRSAELLQRRLESQQFGIKVESVGIRQIMLPESVSEKVFESMKQTRQRIAESARAEGRAKAAAIRSEARSAEQRILAFAERRAQAIRAEGDTEAASYYAAFKGHEDFAIFLRQLEALRGMLSNNTTFVLDAESFSPIQFFSSPPGQAASPAKASAAVAPAPVAAPAAVATAPAAAPAAKPADAAADAPAVKAADAAPVIVP